MPPADQFAFSAASIAPHDTALRSAGGSDADVTCRGLGDEHPGQGKTRAG
jgi:hypothetical protein